MENISYFHLKYWKLIVQNKSNLSHAVMVYRSCVRCCACNQYTTGNNI